MLLWATVKPFRVSLVEPVAYLSDSYIIVAEIVFPSQADTDVVPLIMLDES
jgi:hypothetical protein